MKPLGTRSKADISARLLNEAARQSSLLASKMLNDYKRSGYKSWSEMEKRYDIAIPNQFKLAEFNFSNLSIFIRIWEQGSAARITAAREGTAPSVKIHVEHDVSSFGNLTLKPEQEGAFRAIRDALYINNTAKAAINNGGTGSGKTFLAVALMAWRIDSGHFNTPVWALKPHWFIIITPKKVMEGWKRVIDSAGIGHLLLNRKILVMSNAELNTDFGSMYCDMEENEVTGESRYVWQPMLSPDTVFVDEAHNFIRPGSTRTLKLHALIYCKHRPKVILLSATMAEKVNDGLTYIIASDLSYNGQRITRDNFSFFARSIDSEPNKPNMDGVKRLAKFLAPNIFPFPYIKPKFKSSNRVWIVDFERDKDREIYASAFARYIEVCEKVGKNTEFSAYHKFVALGQFRKTAEPLRVPPMARRIADNYKSGTLATAVFTAYVETIAELVFRLTDTYHIPREHISLVWGGKREYKKEDLLSKDEIDSRLKAGFNSWMGDKDFVRKLKLSTKYLEDKVEHAESSEEQAYRHGKLKALGLLGKQRDNQAQIEIDNFQDGTTKIVICTLASGGVGLSFDRDKEHLLQREGILTPVYNGKEFQQGLGRLVRRSSLSGADQLICMLDGTVESEHVAPILDKKLRTSAVFSNRSFTLVDLLERPVTSGHTAEHIRTKDEAAKDAENDDTLISDFAAKVEVDDDETDAPESLEEILEQT